MSQTTTSTEAPLSRRAAVLALLALPLGDYRAFAQEPAMRGLLTVDLGKWSGIKVVLDGKTTTITSAQIFAALSGK